MTSDKQAIMHAHIKNFMVLRCDAFTSTTSIGRSNRSEDRSHIAQNGQNHGERNQEAKEFLEERIEDVFPQ